MAQKEMYRKCFRCGCSPAEDNVKLFRFPKPSKRNLVRCTFWAKYVFPDKDYSSKQFQYKLYQEHRMLCQKHFNDIDFRDDTKQALASQSVPRDTENEFTGLTQPQAGPSKKTSLSNITNIPQVQVPTEAAKSSENVQPDPLANVEAKPTDAVAVVPTPADEPSPCIEGAPDSPEYLEDDPLETPSNVSLADEVQPCFGRCRCCLSYGHLKSMWVEHCHEDTMEVYGDMIVNCFALSFEPSGESVGADKICEECISRLRDASNFRKMLLESQDALMALANEDAKSETMTVQGGEDGVQTAEPGEELDYEDVEFLEENIIEEVNPGPVPIPAVTSAPKKFVHKLMNITYKEPEIAVTKPNVTPKHEKWKTRDQGMAEELWTHKDSESKEKVDSHYDAKPTKKPRKTLVRMVRENINPSPTPVVTSAPKKIVHKLITMTYKEPEMAVTKPNVSPKHQKLKTHDLSMAEGLRTHRDSESKEKIDSHDASKPTIRKTLVGMVKEHIEKTHGVVEEHSIDGATLGYPNKRSKNEASHVCDECGEVFNTDHEFSGHWLKHSGERLTCGVHGKKYTAKRLKSTEGS